MRIHVGRAAPCLRAPAAALEIGTEIFPPDAPLRNLLLGSLPDDDLSRVRQHMETVRLELREPLFKPDVPISHVYFPETAVISMVSTLSNGSTAEVGTTGCEGMVGLTLFLTDQASSLTAFAQIPGLAGRMSAEAFTGLASVPGALHRSLLRYADAFLTQVAQSATCNATHLVEERCARWLLMTHDRVKTDTFPLTQEFLAFTLGVRRTGVMVAMHHFEDAGMVRYTHGDVQILDRAQLEGASCECYRTVRANFDRLLPRPQAACMLPNA